ncbi:DUF4124 domain-containing protein [Pseudoxanthomonas spadix]|uniref:DUF4124 domain-containing protein n=2 Tax=Pseudoxanthomonas spadix TaxID=415229 RepID=UPI000EFE7582|nr:DUF4124 domain-containing protein [Pseudoxanthomonas spadix]
MSLKEWACMALLSVLSLCAVGAARAQTTIYRCTDAQGQMTVQNAPCPQGSRQDRRQVKDVATQPLPSSLKSTEPAPVRATSASEAPAATASSRTRAPPPLHLSARPDPAVDPPAPSGPATTLYRCTDATGALTVQNSPCPAGSNSQKMAVQGVPSMPLPGNAPAAAAPAATATPAQAAEQPRSDALGLPAPDQAQTIQTIGGMTLIEDPTLHRDDAVADAPAGNAAPEDEGPAGKVTGTAPPILFQCTTYDSGTYLSEDAAPQSRCAPLKTVGLDGNAFNGSGKACQVIYDVCARVPDQRLCSAWKKRLGETEVAARYAKPENEARNRAEYQRVLRIVTEAGCAAQ